LDKDNHTLLFQFKTPSGHLHPAVRLSGYGYPSRHCGLSRCVFRPSDDETVFPYHIPANAMIVVGLRNIIPILEHLAAFDVVKLARTIADQIEKGIQEWGKVQHKEFGEIYAYE